MLEALFFACYYAYLLGNLQEAQIAFSVLKEEFGNVGNKASLKPHQFVELKKIKIALETGCILQKKWLDNSHLINFGQQETSDVYQKELVKIIDHQGRKILEEILQDNLYLYNIEHPCPPYGQVDMVYMGKNTVYPVEVKKDQGNHDLIGQIYKYDLYHKLKLHYKHYDLVRSVTICKSYQPYVITELKQSDIKVLAYSNNSRFTLKEI